MTKYLTGIVSGFLAMLLGGWLMVSPFALGTQTSGAWTGQTLAEFWTGMAVVIVSAVAQIAYGLGLSADLRARGVVQPRPARAVKAPAPVVLQSNEPRLEDLLAPLIAALQQDLNNLPNTTHSGQPVPQQGGHSLQNDRRTS